MTTIYNCHQCGLDTLRPSWSDATVVRVDPDTGPTLDHVHIPLCPLCATSRRLDGAMGGPHYAPIRYLEA
jgi:hypothetical protein